MKYRIIWDTKPARQIKKFDPQIRKIVKKKVDKLGENPHQYSFLSGPLSPKNDLIKMVAVPIFPIFYNGQEVIEEMNICFAHPDFLKDIFIKNKSLPWTVFFYKA